MSKQYTTKPGDTLESIAAGQYGDPTLAASIANANQLQTDPPATGTVLNIPPLPAEEALRTQRAASVVASDAADELAIFIAGVKIQPTSARIIRTMDTGADGWTAVLPWTTGLRPNVDAVTKPYQYNTASAYIGGELLVNGILYGVSPEISNRGRIKNLEGWSYTADAIDSTLKPPYEFNGAELLPLASSLVAPLGIKAVADVDTAGPFDRVTASPNDTIFGFISKLAAQRGILVSSTPQGDMLLTRAQTGGAVATLEEGAPGVMISGANFDGRKRFNAYRAVGQSPGDNAKPRIATDAAVPRSRFLTFTADETTRGNIQDAAQWRKTKTLADALTISIPVAGWTHGGGDIWRENTIVTVISETLFLPNGHDLLVRSVEYALEGDRRVTLLHLVPAEVYTGGGLVDPWT